MPMMPVSGFSQHFQNRQEAGQLLAGMLKPYTHENPVVLALPRGGVPVGYEIAHALHAPLHAFPVRKLGAPQQPELAIGAIAPGGIRVLNQELIDRLHVNPADLNRLIRQETQELDRRCRAYGIENHPPDIEGKTVILTDDGLATGMTAGVAIEALRTMKPARIILAVPVGSTEAVAWLEPKADRLLCLLTPPEFMAVGQWYREFEQTSDAEVIALLRRAAEK